MSSTHRQTFLPRTSCGSSRVSSTNSSTVFRKHRACLRVKRRPGLAYIGSSGSGVASHGQRLPSVPPRMTDLLSAAWQDRNGFFNSHAEMGVMILGLRRMRRATCGEGFQANTNSRCYRRHSATKCSLLLLERADSPGRDRDSPARCSVP